MAFVRLNGWQIAVARNTPRKSHDVVGGSTRTYGGRRMTQRTADKLRLSLRTTLLRQEEAEALRQLMLGKGDVWGFDDGDFYSGYERGAPDTDGATLMQYAAADGAPVVTDARWPGAGVQVDPPSSNESGVGDTEGDAANWTVVNDAAASDVAAHAWVGDGCVRIDLTAPASIGVRAKITRQLTSGGLTGETYVASCYLKALADCAIRTRLRDGTNAIDGNTVSLSLVADEWVRVENLKVTVGALTGANLILELEETVIDTGAIFVVDGIQLEKRVSTTAWMGAGESRTAGVPEYDATFMQKAKQGFTVACWTRGANPETGASCWIFTLKEGATVIAGARTSSGGEEVIFTTIGQAVGAHVQTATGVWDADRSDWHHVAFVFRRRNSAGLPGKEIWRDGVLVASLGVDEDQIPRVEDIESLFIGENPSDTQFWSAPIDDLQVLPYAASPGQILGWQSMTQAMPELPDIAVEGDVLPGGTLLMEGDPATADGGTAQHGGAWRNNMESVELEIVES